MAIKTFAAIYIGSYEVSLKIFEMSQRKQLKKIDHIRSRVELGKDAYTKGVIGYELVEELCQILKQFHSIMEGYRVDDYQAYASSVLRDVSNELFILDQIRLRTNINVQVLSNSEHRFISYKSLAFSSTFEKMIQEGAAVIDVGGGSMQITMFRKGRAITTQQIVLGIMRIREKLSSIETTISHYEDQIREVIDKELEMFKRLYLDGNHIRYAIIVGDYIGDIMKNVEHRKEDDTIECERFLKTLKKFQKKDVSEIAQELNLTNEQDPLLMTSVVVYKRLVEEISADYIWIPGVNISDGIAFDYAETSKILKPEHDFEKDILSAAKFLAGRYLSYSKHSETLEDITMVMFDALKNVHGLSKRHRLLLQTAAILHDCGRYISMVNQGECSYQIIMESEIIGMTHLEREIVARTVMYNSAPLAPYDELKDIMDQESYMVVAKLSAILKIANAMDSSHKQKLKEVKASLKDKQLLVTVEAKEGIALEKALFEVFAESFEGIFSVKPLIKKKRVLD